MTLDLLLLAAMLLNIAALAMEPQALWWHLAIVAALGCALFWRVR